MNATDQRHEVLIDAAKAGDVGAFTRLIGQYQEFAFGYALALLRDFHLAQDAAQEAFVAAYFGLGQLENPQAFAGWLRSIVRHQCHRVLRRPDLEWVSLEGAMELAAELPGPPLSAQVHEQRDLIMQAIRGLSQQQREVLSLFYMKECSQQEIAAFLEVPITTVNMRLHAARNSLQERMINMVAKTLKDSRLPDDFAENIGRIIEVKGLVVDVQFDAKATPDIFDAIAMPGPEGKAVERLKVARRLGRGLVRCIAAGAQEGLEPGKSVINTRATGVDLTPHSGVSALGDEELKHAVELLGFPPAPPPAPQPRLLETGIKPLDLLCPYPEEGNIGLFGIQGVGRIVLVEELIRRLSDRPRGIHIFYLVHRNEPDSVRDMLTKEKGYPGDASGAVQVTWLLTENATDPQLAQSNEAFDAATYCTPLLGVQGLFPAVDPLASNSRLLDPTIVGQEHFEVAKRVRETLSQAKQLMADPVLLEYIACRAGKRAMQRAREFPAQRMAQLGPEDRLLVSRARKIERFLTTPFYVAEPFSKVPAKCVSRADTVRGCKAILDGQYDDVAEHAFVHIGEVGESRQKAKEQGLRSQSP